MAGEESVAEVTQGGDVSLLGIFFSLWYLPPFKSLKEKKHAEHFPRHLAQRRCPPESVISSWTGVSAAFAFSYFLVHLKCFNSPKLNAQHPPGTLSKIFCPNSSASNSGWLAQTPGSQSLAFLPCTHTHCSRTHIALTHTLSSYTHVHIYVGKLTSISYFWL